MFWMDGGKLAVASAVSNEHIVTPCDHTVTLLVLQTIHTHRQLYASDASNTMFDGLWDNFKRRNDDQDDCEPGEEVPPSDANADEAATSDPEPPTSDPPVAEHDPSNDIDDETPPPPTAKHDPWNDVDEDNPPPRARKRPRHQKTSPSFDEVIASAQPPHVGPHRQRPAKPARLAKKHENAKRKRQAKRARAKNQSGHVASASTLRDHATPAVPLAAQLDASTLPSTLGAYSARAPDAGEKQGRKVRRSLPNLLGLGLHLVEWDGVTPRPLVDKMGRIVAVLAGQPDHAEYREAVKLAFQAICDAGHEARFPPSMRNHRRGLFAAMNVGLSYGKGQKVPSWLNNKAYQMACTWHMPRLTILTNILPPAAFSLWAPRLYSLYRECDTKLRHAHPHLRRPFVGSVFFCAAFNFGGNVWTFKHRDILNLAFGWCAVQALGNFDATKGGHLVLWDLKLVVEFPAGALILLPSATIAHSNVPVQEGDERISFTQFSAGGIFRYVDNGCQTVNQLAENNPEEYDRLMDLKAARWEKGLGLLSTLDEIVAME
ncbi:hypothetical protein B0H12DRAFT_1079600 [Mycena haematopus]|nr:hypothetical protein B0H12DRAFT_1079600 [Mycena haematopus]